MSKQECHIELMSPELTYILAVKESKLLFWNKCAAVFKMMLRLFVFQDSQGGEGPVVLAQHGQLLQGSCV